MDLPQPWCLSTYSPACGRRTLLRMVTPGLHRIHVLGGELAVEVHAGSTEPVLAVHGISSHRRLWNWLRAELPELTLVAPDLRGRADSLHVAGASDVRQH